MLQQVLTNFSKLSNRQKVVIVGTLVTLILVVVLFISAALTPQVIPVTDLTGALPESVTLKQLQQQAELAKLKTLVPVSTSSFSISYSEETFHYFVKVKSEKNFEADFNKWLKDKGLTDIDPAANFLITK